MYYALDNCESSDEVHEEHKGRLLPAAYRANLPLRHLVEFAHVFGCSADSAGVVRFPLGRRSSCAVVLPECGRASPLGRATDVCRNCVARTSSSYFSATPAM
ncbi:hypothetical protein MTO96_037217 [Rhipicephalus appendiculatus]